MANLPKNFIPQKINVWAAKVFSDWSKQRNSRLSETDADKCHDDLLEIPDIHKLNQWLSYFATEVRLADEKPYFPPAANSTIKIMLESNPNASWFCDRHNTASRDHMQTCDTVFYQLHIKEIGTVVKDMATVQDEQKLWDTGTIGIQTLKFLQCTILL